MFRQITMTDFPARWEVERVEERSHDSRTYSTRVMLRRLDGDKALAIYGRPIVTTAGNASGVSAQMTPPEPVDEMLDAEDPVFSGWGTLFSGSTRYPPPLPRHGPI